jgi:hypothetical protein
MAELESSTSSGNNNVASPRGGGEHDAIVNDASLLSAVLSTVRAFRRSTNRIITLLQAFNSADERRLSYISQPIIQRVGTIDEDLKSGRLRIDLLELRTMLLVAHAKLRWERSRGIQAGKNVEKWKEIPLVNGKDVAQDFIDDAAELLEGRGGSGEHFILFILITVSLSSVLHSHSLLILPHFLSS